MAASVSAKAAPYDIPLFGFERMFNPMTGIQWMDTACYAYLPRGDGEARLEAHAQRAFKELSIKHPRMRGQLKVDTQGHLNGVMTILPELSAAAIARVVKVRTGNWKTM